MAKKSISLTRPSDEPTAPADLDKWVADNSKVDTEKTKRVAADIPISVHMNLKMFCTREDRKIGDVLREMIVEKFG